MNPRLPLNAFLYLAIALAAALGGSLRYGISLAWLQVAGVGFPWPTLIVNVLGSFLIALYWRLAGPGGRYPAGLERRTAVMTGFCGGLTTFSLFGVETMLLLENGRVLSAAGYVAATTLGGPGAAWLGLQDFRHGTARPE
ncbi:MAG: CrcB family protein [Wenzhouxiangellaceae bacterium]